MSQRLLAIGLAAALLATSAGAQVGRPGYAPGSRSGFKFQLNAVVGSALTGDCSKTPFSGAVLQSCADPVNGSYTSDGTTGYSTLAATPGGSMPAGCTISFYGLQCSGTDVASLPANNTANSVFIVKVYGGDGSATNGFVAAAIGGSGTNSTNSYSVIENNTGGKNANNQNKVASTGSSSPATVAMCSDGSTTYAFISAGGVSGSISSFLLTSSTKLFLGNSSNGSAPTGGSAFYLVSARVYGLGGQTCNASLVQASANAG